MAVAVYFKIHAEYCMNLNFYQHSMVIDHYISSLVQYYSLGHLSEDVGNCYNYCDVCYCKLYAIVICSLSENVLSLFYNACNSKGN